MEMEAYEVIVEDGKLVFKQSGKLVESEDGSKSIFVLSTTRSLYNGQKKKGSFQHSSFLSGAATTAAGRLKAHGGVLEAIWPYSGHYLPTDENFKEFISFLEENHVDLTNVKVKTKLQSYEVIVEDGKLVFKQSGMLVGSEDGSKSIFVLSTTRPLNIGQKKKGSFQHSSFLSGAATTAARRLKAHGGALEAIWPYSGHYLPVAS